MVATIKINVPEKIYERDPEQTQLGRKIINHSIRLIDELGFEAFTFKKLATRINSTEASIYRYFENKHNLLVYLVSWYWSWLEYQIDYQTHNIGDSEKKLKIAIKVVAESMKRESTFSYINESALYRIVISESSKAYYTKSVDADNQEGFFRSYKSLCKKIASFVHELNPEYAYAHALISTMLESAHHQVYFSQHLPSLTELKIRNQEYDQVIEYLEHLVFTMIQRQINK
ncbi:MAG: TetR/AcrR family transcriptional regulator [Microscillaceae bacterium]|jgi:AcrR family transcriptional regulator|nr:TetR/AcrR family transcriptional regulator [Microscillaceae bacterium]